MDLMIWVVTIALLAYVAYAIYTTPKGSGCLAADAQRARESEAEVKAEKAEVKAETASELREAQPAAAEPPVAPAEQPAVAEPAAAVVEQLRNPVTGETAAVPTNYRFAKKWIKEALVAEGLLDRVYKNAELDEAASEKVKAALEQFKNLAKYQA